MAWGKTVGVASWVDRLKADDQTLTSVTVFRGRLFGPSEAAEVCDALRSNTALREFYASGHAVDVETAGKFADMLTVNKTIQYICIGDASFGDEGVAALARGIASSASLRAVDLENKGMGDEGARALGAALGESKVTELNISHNDALTDAGLAAVCLGAAAGRTVTSLRVAGLSVGPESCAAVSKLLASSGGALRRLDATDAKMDPGGIMARGVALRDDGGEGSGSLDELVLDGTRLGDDGAAALRDATHVLVSVPPTERETSERNREDTLSIDPVLADAASVAALERSGAEENEIAWLAYLSSTGVYGDHAGKFVDETSPCAPTTAKTRARLDAERAWAAFARSGKGPKGTNRNLPLRVFRLGGVYGPRRSLLDAARE